MGTDLGEESTLRRYVAYAKMLKLITAFTNHFRKYWYQRLKRVSRTTAELVRSTPSRLPISSRP
ncbi:hypothetical protein, partial [Pseudoalteromonas sp. GABNS16H]|uniref:hypothetical protein n=1 Tax=Pseudoalteromonas sp. GABNS16H TaxID=3025325 RepID=UPI00235E8489